MCFLCLVPMETGCSLGQCFLCSPSITSFCLPQTMYRSVLPFFPVLHQKHCPLEMYIMTALCITHPCFGHLLASCVLTSPHGFSTLNFPEAYEEALFLTTISWLCGTALCGIKMCAFLVRRKM